MYMKKIITENEYEEALKYVDSLMLAEANTPEIIELKKWVSIIEEYEDIHYPI